VKGKSEGRNQNNGIVKEKYSKKKVSIELEQQKERKMGSRGS
jgi:hypothetical protein